MAAAAPMTPIRGRHLAPSRMLFLDIDDPEYKRALLSVISRGKGGYSLRKFDYGYQACYASAIVYILIGMISGKDVEEKNYILQNLLSFNNLTSSLLKNIIFNNAAQPSSIQIYNTISLTDVFEHDILFLGLVTTDEDVGTHQYGLILHYFILKRRYDGNYDIISSYGSYHVGIRQYQTMVTAAEFDAFIEAIEKPGKSAEEKGIISTFMKVHFLDIAHKTDDRKTVEDYKEYTQTTIPKDDPRLAKSTPEEVELEVDKYLGRSTILMLFPNIIDIFQNEINVSQLKRLKKSMEEGQGDAKEFAEAEAIARESGGSLSEKMAKTYRTVTMAFHDSLPSPESVPKSPKTKYSPEVFIQGTPRLISDAAVEEVERIVASESPEEEPKEAEDEDALAECNFPEIPAELLKEVGLTEETSPVKKRTRSGATFGGKRKTKRKRKTKKNRKTTRKYKLR
jgi:hypothetical protein